MKVMEVQSFLEFHQVSDLKRTLNKYGVEKFALFPNIDGLAAHIEWLQSKRE